MFPTQDKNENIPTSLFPTQDPLRSVPGETLHTGKERARVASMNDRGHAESQGRRGQEHFCNETLFFANTLCCWMGTEGHTHRPNKSQKACPGERPVRDRDSICSDRDSLPEEGRGYQAVDNSLTTRKTRRASGELSDGQTKSGLLPSTRLLAMTLRSAGFLKMKPTIISVRELEHPGNACLLQSLAAFFKYYTIMFNLHFLLVISVLACTNINDFG